MLRHTCGHGGWCVVSCFNASHVFTVSPRPLLLLQLGRTWGKSLNSEEKLCRFSGRVGVSAILAHALILEKEVRAGAAGADSRSKHGAHSLKSFVGPCSPVAAGTVHSNVQALPRQRYLLSRRRLALLCAARAPRAVAGSPALYLPGILCFFHVLLKPCSAPVAEPFLLAKH